ncbi:MmgE/PrpD family protein [Sporomusa aerivorans]|uniref:MmgE/PrpD family protein n=1 Tax=Sporomusa aerivorans TaxID=204936 RepID=UPI00352A9F07
MNVTAQLVDNIFEYSNKVPDEVLAKTQELVLDALGVAIAGSKTAEGEIIAKFVQDMRGTGQATVIGMENPMDPVRAALANGTMGYSIGLTDTHALSITHPGSAIIPAALAVAEQEGRSGEELLKAITLGYEVVTRLGRAINPSHRARGFHTSATCNPFGAATAAALLLGCTKEQLTWALGIAGSTSSGLFEFRQNGDMTMAFHGGWPAQSGVTAAYMAKKGFTGPKTILEGQDGFFKAMSDKHDAVIINQDFGKRFSVEAMSLRAYCACRYAHTAIEAIGKMKKRRNGIAAADLQEITVYTHKTAIDQETEPNTLVGARLCTVFNLALAILYGPKLTEIQQSDLHDEKVLEVYKKIKVIEDPNMTAQFPQLWTSRVAVKFTDGTMDEETMDYAKGDPANPMSSEEITNKFQFITSSVMTPAKAEGFLNKINRLRSISVRELMQTLAKI